MKLLDLSISGFRGIQQATITFGGHDVIVGPGGSGKSTIIDALSLIFGRTRLVRDLTEHDFFGSCPEEQTRIRLIATLGGFPGNTPDAHDNWFREGRSVPKWWNPQTNTAEPQKGSEDLELCAQIAFAARFDVEELYVETLRYFHDDDSIDDPFLDYSIQSVPTRLLDDIGYYVLPARRTWEATASFASELFRRAVVTVGGIPAGTVLEERNRLRNPSEPLEEDENLRPLAQRINDQLQQLLPAAPRFQLRVTATDSDSLLRALVPHYQEGTGVSLPVGRHGMGLLSLQTFLLLLEIGRERRHLGKPFLFALEEPELHIPPGLQRRLVAQAVSIAEQTICTSHSPRVAAWYPATAVQLLDRRPDIVVSTPLLAKPLESNASNAVRKLCDDNRSAVVEALMYHRVLIPEGRSDYEWLRMLVDVIERGDVTQHPDHSSVPSFGTVVGVIPTHDSAVTETVKRLHRLRSGLVMLVDGDPEGDRYISDSRVSPTRPDIILQWQDGWSIEDAIGWILKGAGLEALSDLQSRIDTEFDTIDALVALFKVKAGPGRLKTDYLSYESVVSVIGSNSGCRERALALLHTLTAGCLALYEEPTQITYDHSRSSEGCVILRLSM